MFPYHSLSVFHSKDGLTARYGLRNGEEYTAQFATRDSLLKALADAGTTIITDNHLIKQQLKARQDVVTQVHVTTPKRLLKAGFLKEPIAA